MGVSSAFERYVARAVEVARLPAVNRPGLYATVRIDGRVLGLAAALRILEENGYTRGAMPFGNPPSDLDARSQHVYDQVQAILRDMAPVLRRYYEVLVDDEGFEPDQAMALVLAAQIRMTGGMEEFFKHGDDPETAD